MDKVKELLEGKKTYLVCAAMFVVAGLHAIKSTIPVVQSVPDDYFKQLMAFLQGVLDGGGLLPLGLAALRAGIAKDQ
jgi:hypothetical protein